jgi:hypothetical protein
MSTIYLHFVNPTISFHMSKETTLSPPRMITNNYHVLAACIWAAVESPRGSEWGIHQCDDD